MKYHPKTKSNQAASGSHDLEAFRVALLGSPLCPVSSEKLNIAPCTTPYSNLGSSTMLCVLTLLILFKYHVNLMC